MPAQLPGYFWDEAKKKYFKIEENHLASSGSQYSSEAVSKRNDESKKRKLEKAHQRREKKQKLRRSALLSPVSVSGTKIREEIGYVTSTADVHEKRREITCRYPQIHHLWGKDGISDSFVVEPVYGNTLFVENDAHSGWCNLVQHWYHDHPGSAQIQKMPIPARSVNAITSISSNEQRITAVTSLADSDSRGSIAILSLPRNPEFGDLPPLSNHVEYTLNNDQSAFASAANPEFPSFACGLTERWCIIGARDSNFQQQQDKFVQVESDVLSVDWLNAYVFAGGLRNGEIFLHDTRSRGTASRVKHLGLPGRLSFLDESRFVAAGPEDAMCMYDLRMPRVDLHYSHGRGNPELGSVNSGITATQPVIRYPYKNSARIPGLAVCKELGLLAASSDHAPIEIWSLHSGRKLRQMSIPSKKHGEDHQVMEFPDMAKCLQFTTFLEKTQLFASYCGQLFYSHF